MVMHFLVSRYHRGTAEHNMVKDRPNVYHMQHATCRTNFFLPYFCLELVYLVALMSEVAMTTPTIYQLIIYAYDIQAEQLAILLSEHGGPDPSYIYLLLSARWLLVANRAII